MSNLSLTLFGAFQPTLDEQPVSFATDKCRALLVYPAVGAGRVHRREALAALL